MSITGQRRAEARCRYYTRDEARRLGWDSEHPASGGQFLEEQEVVDYFPALKNTLGLDRPDFVLLSRTGLLSAIVECKNDYRELDVALEEAKGYARAINERPSFDVRLAIGVAGTPDKLVRTRVAFLRANGQWVDLKSHGYALTQLPTPDELNIALERGNGTTDVELPTEHEFYDAAVKINRILRLAKIEEAARPKTIGAIIVALYHDEFNTKPDKVLEHINMHVDVAVDELPAVPAHSKKVLRQTLHLSTDAESLRDRIDDVIHQLNRLNVRSVMRSGVDFLGKFYETFLRYGSDAKSMGIVFTPRHITKFCAELVDVRLGMSVYDPACGTGGFLVAAFDRMWQEATSPKSKELVKRSLHGSDTNATVWALAVLNMFFRGDGKSNIQFGSCFAPTARRAGDMDRVLLNPPFAQEGEPEVDFIDHSLEALKPGGEMAVVLPARIMVDNKLSHWRANLVTQHHVLGVISLPSDLFYPTAAPTAILIVRAHAPNNDMGTFLARVENDGYKISKKRRVERPGSQLARVLTLYRQFLQRGEIATIPGLACSVDRSTIIDGGEIVAQKHLPSATFERVEFESQRKGLLRSMSLAVAQTPDVIEELTEDFEDSLASGPRNKRPSTRCGLSQWFKIEGGRTTQASSYPGGGVPYISSGDQYNSIDDFLTPPEDEVFTEPCITVTGFGQAYIQPWRCCVRGGAGSAPHVLVPKVGMSLAELMWFAGQINDQRWRFYYGRMASKTRLRLLEVDPPPSDLPVLGGLIERLRHFQTNLDGLYDIERRDVDIAAKVRELADDWYKNRPKGGDLADMAAHLSYQRIIGMGERAVKPILAELSHRLDHWFWALHAITGDDPVPEDARGNLERMRDAWIAWGKAQGYIG